MPNSRTDFKLPFVMPLQNTAVVIFERNKREQSMNHLKPILLSVVCACLLPIATFAGPVDVNSATAEVISAELKGVGISKATAIVEYRKAHGPFKSDGGCILLESHYYDESK